MSKTSKKMICRIDYYSPDSEYNTTLTIQDFTRFKIFGEGIMFYGEKNITWIPYRHLNFIDVSEASE